MNKERTIAVWTLAALLCLCAAGCYMGERYIAEEPFSEQAIAEMRQGGMTKRDVLLWFGPPVAVARKGTIMTFPPPGIRKEGWQNMQSDAFFELVPPRPGNADGRIIYYYYAPRITMNGVFSLLIASGYTRRIKTDELWFLIDERTGKVEDFVLRTPEIRPAAGGQP